MPTNGHGGARAGAGRPRGASVAKRRIQSLREKYPKMPLQYMLEVINSDKFSHKQRMAMAKAGAPYVHARLAAATIESTLPPQRYAIDPDKLDENELIFMQRIMMKAGVPREDGDEVLTPHIEP
jgi:hypothetical protein